MADRTVKVVLDATISGFQSKMRAAKGAVQDFSSNTSKWLEKNEANLDKMSSASMKVGALMTAGFGLAVKAGADFEASMSGVQAATMETSDNMGVLREAILQAGADTQFSATQAADAVEALSKAGVSTQDILHGGLKGALDLAAAGELDVGQAAEIAATSMNQFGLKGKDVSHISDLLAASAGKAMGDVTDMAGAMKFVGPVASQMGVSIEETAGSIAYLAQQGVLGEQAGTSLRGMLSSLTSPSKIASSTMKDLGINVYDAWGKFVGFRGVAEQLQSSMSGLTNAERDQALGRIFGNEQITTARILYQGGAKAIDEWTAAVNDNGYAAEQAAIRTDNLKGDIERLGGSLETVFIKGGTGANDALRGLTQGAEAVVDAFGRIPEPILNVTTMIVGAGGLVALGVGGLSKLAIFVNNTKLAFTGLGVSAKAASLSVGLIGGALAIGGLAIGAWMQHVAEAKAKTDAYKQSLDEATGAITASTRQMAANSLEQQGILKIAQDMGLSLSTVVDAVLGEKDALDQVNAASERYLQNGRSYAAGAGQGAAAQNTHTVAVNKFNDAINGQNKYINDSIDAKKREIEASEETGAAQDGMGASVDATTGLIQDQTGAVSEQDQALQDLMDTIAQSDASFIDLQGGYDQLRDAAKQMAQDTADATDSASDSWEDYYDGVTVSMEDYLTALEEQVQAQQDWEKNMLILSGRVSQGVIDELSKLGPEGAPLVAQLVNASDDELARLEDVYSQRSDEATGAFAANLSSASPVLAEIMRTAGADAVGKAAEELSSGKKTMQDIIKEYNLNFTVDAKTGQAIENIRQVKSELLTLPNSKTITIETVSNGSRYGVKGSTMAGGGSVAGPGTGTSDSVGPIWLSNGEYVVREQAASRHRALLDAINYGGGIGMAGGGSVGQVPVSMLAPSVSVAAPVFPSDGWSISGSLDVGGRLVELVDARITRNDRAMAGWRS